ncbi:Protein NLRC5 [Holothuria leucospilota]|uniref:Protein NLRC5 n=1 Tax=Holothuria leucospilota TaxID=206669 RepID=A0A9Q1CTZ9_HOLLE|nr:Protein NLRC5 [Holothuria leucospilota]
MFLVFLAGDNEVICISPQFLELGKTGIIDCSSQVHFSGVLWYDTRDYLLAEPILHYRRSLKTGSGYDSGEYDILQNGSLVIQEVLLKHERTFTVAYLHSEEKEPIPINVKVLVIVYPVPAYPLVNGCDHQQYCLLEVKREGFLNCTLLGIRPLVDIEWKVFHHGDTDLISFRQQRVTIIENGETFNVTVTTSYLSRVDSLDKITLECGVVEAKYGFILPTKVEIEFVEESTTYPITFQATSNHSDEWMSVTLIIAIAVLVIVCAVITIRCIVKRKIRRAEENMINADEASSMLKFDVQNISGLKEKFVKEITGKYKDQYEAVQPIPYIKDRLYCVEKVFVEGGIEFLESKEGESRRGIWKTLETYENIFDDEQVRSVRRILEGEPGYGKSTVALKFAYDWCNPKPTSSLQDVEILILLRLRQLGGVPSIYKAIKRFILPRDSTIKESDIESILRNSERVVVILDGFDEYPDQDSTTITDVRNIIARSMFQEFEVITTTRSSCLPKQYPPLTKQIRLTGFDDNAHRDYIRKAVVGNDEDGVRRIEKYLHDNPILSDLCQVPLLFVLFAHMTYENEQFRKLNSVTSFFRHMIHCFHSHMINKMDDENVRKYEMFENNHQDLDKLAFEAFSGQSQRIVWDKDEMCQLIGKEFYDQYIRIGILVEEEVINIVNDPGTPITEHILYKKEVRFYHKLFCEWYAAHYLSEYIKRNPDLDLSASLCHLHPFDVQYLNRFSCGLNSSSGEKIIKFLKTIEGGDQFAILCILEQTGKIGNIKETIRQLCSKGIIISRHESLLLQRSSLQLLHIAAKNEIPIEYVNLHDCFHSVDSDKAAVMTTAGLFLQSSIPFKKLRVSLYKREMTEDEVNAILDFSSWCTSLHTLVLFSSVPPRGFVVGPTLNALNSKQVKVQYHRVFTSGDSPQYILNLRTGLWERESDCKECTDEDFEEMNSTWTKLRDFTDEKHKEAIKKHRDIISKEIGQRKTGAGENNGNIRTSPSKGIGDHDDARDGGSVRKCNC